MADALPRSTWWRGSLCLLVAFGRGPPSLLGHQHAPIPVQGQLSHQPPVLVPANQTFKLGDDFVVSHATTTRTLQLERNGKCDFVC